MNIFDRAVAAYEDKRKKEQAEIDRRAKTNREDAEKKMRLRLIDFFGGDVEFEFMEYNGHYARATIADLAGVELQHVWNDRLLGVYNACEKEIKTLIDLGELLLTPPPAPPAAPKQKKSEARFATVSIDRANELHNAGREFDVKGAFMNEEFSDLMIEFTDLWKFNDDDDLPF